MRKIKLVVGLLILIFVAVIFINVTKLYDHPKLPLTSVPRKSNGLNPHFQDLLQTYEATIRDLQEQTRTPGIAIAIVQDTSIVYLKSFGIREAEKPDSIDIHSVFRLASVSKCFAPVLAGLLVEDNVLSWNDRVVKYLPDFSLKNKQYTDSLTLRHVLSHTTGLPYHTYTTLVEDGLDLHTMLVKLKEVDPIDKPGEVYSYQNVAYSIIAEVVKAATGKSYEELMIEKVFKPLHMSNASIDYESIMQNKNVAKPHLMRAKGWSAVTINNTYYNVSPAGGINASISDMAEWLKACLGARKDFISDKTLEEIYTPTVKAKSKNRNFRKWLAHTDSFYALGWRVLNFKNDTLLYHGGYVNGYRSEIALNRRNKIGICVLTNAPGSLPDNSVPYFFHLYFGQREAILSWDHQQTALDAEAEIVRNKR